MKLRRNEPCPCGSGLKAKRCHAASGWADTAGIARQRALAHAHNLAAFYPSLRPRGARFASFADSVAAALPEGPLPALPGEVNRGRALLDGAERRRLVASFAEGHPGEWEMLLAAAGEAALLERALLAGAILSAIGDRRPPPRALLQELESERFPRGPRLLGLVFPPMGVWSVEDAESVPPSGRGFERALEERVTDAEEERLRAFATRLARRLPFQRLPRISDALAEACTDVARDRDALRRAAAALLEAYALQLQFSTELHTRLSWN